MKIKICFNFFKNKNSVFTPFLFYVMYWFILFIHRQQVEEAQNEEAQNEEAQNEHFWEI